MAELLIALNPRNYSDLDPKFDALIYKKGHVVVARPDGWKWGKAETKPDFLLVKLPGEAVSKYDNLTAGDDANRRLKLVEAAYVDTVATPDVTLTDEVFKTKVKDVTAAAGP